MIKMKQSYCNHSMDLCVTESHADPGYQDAIELDLEIPRCVSKTITQRPNSVVQT